MIHLPFSRQPGSRPVLKGPVLKGKATAFAVYACGAGLTYLAQLVVARTIGMTAYGVYAYVFSIVTLLAYLAALGFDVSLLRFLPAYQSQEQWGLMRGVVLYAERNALRAGGLIAVLGLVVVMAFGQYGAARNDFDVRGRLWPCAGVCPVVDTLCQGPRVRWRRVRPDPRPGCAGRVCADRDPACRPFAGRCVSVHLPRWPLPWWAASPGSP